MSEQQAGEWKSACPHPEAVGKRWGDPISEERKAELKVLADKQREWVAKPEGERGESRFKHVSLTGADMYWLGVESGPLPGGVLDNLHLEGAFLGEHLEGANLWGAHLEGTSLATAHLEGAALGGAHLEGATLANAHLEGAFLWAFLEEADLRAAFFDKTSSLSGARLRGAYFDQAMFDGTNLTVVDWSLVDNLGDEMEARKAKYGNGVTKSPTTRLDEFKAAVRANRILAVALRTQGLNEDADRFAYRAQYLQRRVLRRQGKPFRALFSWFLDLLAGHGYKPERTLVAYLIAILGFATAYFFIGQAVGPHLSPLGAFVFSMTSFHGRGFFPGGVALDDPLTVLAAFEAFVGLVIEVSFIATFTQRFFAR